MEKFFICKECGNMIAMVQDKGGPLTCCGKEMTLLAANTTDAATEKHVPVVEKTESGINVKVGSVLHPMEEAHYIQFIYIKTEKGGQFAKLKAGASPEADFCLAAGDKALEVYEYCNLHGLWKTEVR